MGPNTTLEQLHNSLSLDCDMANSLVNLLTEEQNSLIKLNADVLVELSQEKEKLMLALESRFRDKIDQASHLGFGQGFEGLRAHMAQVGQQDSRIPERFNTFQALMQKAQRLNDLNGSLVSEQLMSLQARVQILIESARPEVPRTYGPDGAMNSSAVSATSRAAARLLSTNS